MFSEARSCATDEDEAVHPSIAVELLQYEKSALYTGEPPIARIQK
jgi:hypothetical protein